MIGLGLDLSLKWRPTGGLDPLVSAFKAESGATDLTGLDNLIKYVRSEGLINNFVIYPMKADQSAGSGPTVYSLGGLTPNNMTLINSPTWGATGITFNGTNQAGRIADFSAGGSLTLFTRISNQTEPVSSDPDSIFGQWDPGANKRSAAIFSYGIGSAAAGSSSCSLVRSSDGIAAELYGDKKAITWATDSCRVAEWTDSGGRNAWINKVQESLTLNFGTTQTSRFNTDIDFTFMANLNSGALINFAAANGIAAAVYEGILTTTQRETITDFINAL